jgi:uncharacterized protein (TIGR02145 family)
MARFLLLVLMMSVARISFGQDLSITFAGTGASNQIDSVTATNLTTGQIITLPGSATLILTPKTGIPVFEENAAEVMIFPNPFSGRTTIMASVPEPQQLKVKVQNLVGQVIAQTEVFLQPGDHQFDLSVSAAGIYLVSLTTDQGTTGYKVICSGSSGSGNSIQYAGALSYRNDSGYKSGLTSYTLGYSSGDTILYRCVSGKFTAIFTDSPLESKNYKVEFAPIASFTISPAGGTTETRFEFDASGCTDAETSPDDLEVRWDFDGDGNWDTDYDQSKTSICQYPTPGSYSVILDVKDGGGLIDTETKTVTVTLPGESFIDNRDGHIYSYKTIGTQTWMAENLAWLPSVSPSSAGSETSSYYYIYGYEGTSTDAAKTTANYTTFGVLYNWVAAKTACPTGWHLPDDAEWKVLEKNQGMSDSDADAEGWRSSGTVGGKLKESGTTHWLSPNTGATNTSGFTALPGGYRLNGGGFSLLDNDAIFCAASGYDALRTWFRNVDYHHDGVYRGYDSKGGGVSVRCLKGGAMANTAPKAGFTISPETRTTETKFELDASPSTDAETAADDLEVRWDFDGDGNWDTDYDVLKTFNLQFPSPGAVTIILEVKDAGGLTDTTMQTLNIAYPTFTDPRDGNVYPYKRIENQLWMIRDMAWLPSVSPYSVGSTTDKIYYVVGYTGTDVAQAKASQNYGIYGALYNGVAAQDACPSGWHTASDEEWKILEKYLGMTDADLNLNAVSFRNTGNVGNKLKEAGTSHWISPNVGATNSSGFTALPGNGRGPDAIIYPPGPAAAYWTGTSSGGSTWQRALMNTEAGVLRYFETNDWGMSVRCVKNP